MTRRFSRQNLPLDLVALRSATGAGSSVPAGELYYHLAPDQFDRLLAATWRVGRVIVQTFLATNVAPLVLRPQESRYYLFIQNQSALASMVVNFGTPAGAFGIVPTNGIIIPPNLGFYEPLLVPQDEISVIASAVNTPGVIVYSTLPGPTPLG